LPGRGEGREEDTPYSEKESQGKKEEKRINNNDPKQAISINKSSVNILGLRKKKKAWANTREIRRPMPNNGPLGKGV